MFRRKLLALGYERPDAVNVNDVKQFRNFILWLEDQKIRHYKIEERAGLRNPDDAVWAKSFENYLKELNCPYPKNGHASVTDWLLGYAVRLEYGDNVDQLKEVVPLTLQSTEGAETGGGSGASSNPLDSLDFNGPDFKAGVASLALMLQIAPYDDHLEQLKAICIIARDRLSKKILQSPKQSDKTEVIPIDKMELGFDTGDYIINEAAKILRLLHLRDLRELQTQINQAIVAVQNITANPKTDTRLGKVGRM